MTQIKVKQVAHLCIFTLNIDDAKAFYKDVLGMDSVFHFSRDGKVFGFYLDAGGRPHVQVFQNNSAG